MFFASRSKMEMVAPDKALPGRPEPLPTAETHFLTGLPLKSAGARRDGRGDVRHGLLLGGRTQVLASCRASG